MAVSRRSFLCVTSLLPLASAAPLAQAPSSPAAAVPPGVSAAFPAHDPEVAREMVAVSHGNVARVRELLKGRPALANASWDWGYGDWESALGAASHVGNHEIARLLLAAGARPSIFSAAMLGHLDAVRAFIVAAPGIQKTRGPHGLTLLSHARAGGAVEVVKYLEAVGDADLKYTNEPLSEPDRAAIVGIYAFASGATDRLTVTVGERGPSIQREGGTPRNLFHLGGRVFHPPGAEAVRIRFDAGERAATVSVEDGPVLVTARRAGDTQG
jgi:hypothetical protein